MDGHDYRVRVGATATFGRVLLSARDQHLVIDGPVRNGCPGEAVTPAELFLGGVASCAVELIQVIARERGLVLTTVDAEIGGTVDRSASALFPAQGAARVPGDVTLFSAVALRIVLGGVGDEEAAALVAAFKAR